MPRKKPFSGKAKKQQLSAKRARKRQEKQRQHQECQRAKRADQNGAGNGGGDGGANGGGGNRAPGEGSVAAGRRGLGALVTSFGGRTDGNRLSTYFYREDAEDVQRRRNDATRRLCLRQCRLDGSFCPRADPALGPVSVCRPSSQRQTWARRLETHGENEATQPSDKVDALLPASIPHAPSSAASTLPVAPAPLSPVSSEGVAPSHQPAKTTSVHPEDVSDVSDISDISALLHRLPSPSTSSSTASSSSSSSATTSAGTKLTAAIEPTTSNRLSSHPRALLDHPVRPAWTAAMSKRDVEAREAQYFAEWTAKIHALDEQLDITPFEHNLEVWRQLWRVCEFSDAIVLVADVRYPTFHIPPSLVRALRPDGGNAKIDDDLAGETTRSVLPTLVIVLNKVDLVSEAHVRAWTAHLRQRAVTAWQRAA